MAAAMIIFAFTSSAFCLGLTLGGATVALLLMLVAGAAGVAVWIERHRRRLRVDFRRLRGDLTHANERAAGFRSEKTQILRIAMYDLVAPLSDLSSNVESLSKESLPPGAAKTLCAAENNVARMRRALSALTELQALEERSRSVVLTGVNVGAVLLEAVAHNRALAEKKAVRISVPASDRTTLAMADPEVLRRVFENLIHDALEVTPFGSTVSLSVYQTSDRVLITVSDDGPGVAVSDQTQLLAQSGNSRPPMGTPDGAPRLNLGMVHNLVKAMDGWLWTQGEPGRGTTHVVELALAEAPRPAPLLAKK